MDPKIAQPNFYKIFQHGISKENCRVHRLRTANLDDIYSLASFSWTNLELNRTHSEHVKTFPIDVHKIMQSKGKPILPIINE